MKTKLHFSSKIQMIFSLGALAVFVVSCGSYQNSSYYDNDAIYGNDEPRQETVQYNDSEADQNGEAYAQKFRFMQDEYQQQYDYFTDVDQYSSQENDTVVTVYKNNYNDSNQYAGWGAMTMM
ncbi:hypothetical protein DI487_11695 [Flavobacterium sediminis]|uniref:Uncharacterized protein n=1 Tax=Flavobacterium sediminis TaxID=2201181 RepID=A0A2U8QX41_9FLAO|nr:hypothetical protein [Flavobacterium sediminis]AWM14454.1 hypothetical protein DI487_11695 [Flavobacterium sediminis]